MEARESEIQGPLRFSALKSRSHWATGDPISKQNKQTKPQNIKSIKSLDIYSNTYYLKYATLFPIAKV